MDAPNIIRCMGPAAIIQQYQAYCEENEITLLGSSTMFRILSECSATVRKSLEGLDYFVAEGSRGFQDLQDIVLSEGYPETSNGTELNRLLLEAKRYMKTDYKVHVSGENEVADHCRKFALSSTKEEHFKDKCNHDHNKVCESCEQLKELLHGILKEVEIANFTDQQTRDDIVYRAQQAVESIFLWKSHILRARNQEAAKSFLFNSMKEDEIFVVFDWALKYLPCKYREDQLDWFGKRGISWHISVCFRRNAEELQSLTFVHIFDSQVSQDSKTTSATICDVLNNVLKAIQRPLKELKKNVKCQIKVVKIQTRDTATKNQASIPGITSYNNFVFENGGLRVWKAYGIGPGLLIPWTTIVKTSQYALCPLLVEDESCTEDLLSFGCVKKIKNEENNEESLFTCPTDGCMKSFSKYKDLELHLHVNNCTLVPEKQCRIDLTKTLYVEKLKTSETRTVVKFSDTVQSSGETDLDQGWALRKQRKTTRFNDKQKKFLDEKFKQGTITGNKADPTEVANEMRHKKLANGDRMFEISEPSYGSESGYGSQSGYGSKSGQRGESGYEGEFGYGSKSGYGVECGYGSKSEYGGEFGYGCKSGYGSRSGYEGKSGQRGESGYGSKSGYGVEFGYGSKSGQGGESGYGS
ncbi:Hypothetical predicted protein [Mytilus galloprovincialis]|uniref:C2H2-type domain-containing protein n=1 Tax=Mytilus galloprovincialis TaxID=29158 RepID=A0A8B6HKS3_MYTGA|nr:Hypothetical predicted protein [Mytilus galloprovincialis]